MAVPQQLRSLTALMAEQQGVQQGAPGGLVQGIDRVEREQGLRFAEKNRPKNVQPPAVVAPDFPDAHDLMAVHINRLMSRIIASKYFFKEYEAPAIDWLESVPRSISRAVSPGSEGGEAGGNNDGHCAEQRALSCSPRHVVGVPSARCERQHHD